MTQTVSAALFNFKTNNISKNVTSCCFPIQIFDSSKTDISNHIYRSTDIVFIPAYLRLRESMFCALCTTSRAYKLRSEDIAHYNSIMHRDFKSIASRALT